MTKRFNRKERTEHKEEERLTHHPEAVRPSGRKLSGDAMLLISLRSLRSLRLIYRLKLFPPAGFR